jgi:hypothetical protein
MTAILLRLLPGLAAAVALVGALWWSYDAGADASDRRWEAAQAKAAAAARAREVELQGRADQLAADLEAAREKRRVVTRTITKEVPVYVQSAPVACAAAGLHAPGFRVLHDAAAAGVVPDPARVAAAAPVEPAAAAATIADNYATCNDLRQQLLGWQRWWSEVSR